ncbi:MAG: tyrosine-type recombinase/integrase [Acidimicrobiales bacterium]|nr:tyrosine-type recombinase/integrase [Acidimicrobiales bacterium]
MKNQELPKPGAMHPVFHRWLESLPLLEDKPPTTVRAYGQALRRVAYFAEIPPASFGPAELGQANLTDAVRRMRASGEVSKATLNQTLAAVGSFFDWCLAERLVDEAPDIRRIRKISKLGADRSDPEYYRPAELEDLFQEAGQPSRSRIRWPARDLAMCAFLAVLGLRASELTDSTLDWVSRERLEDADGAATWMLQVLGKGRKTRRLPLSDELVAANGHWQRERQEEVDRLRALIEDFRGHPHGDPERQEKQLGEAKRLGERADRFESAPHRPLFLTNDGERFTYRQLHYWLSRLNREAALRARSPHSLRHTAGVQLASDGVPMNVIQSLLGHARVATTGIYTELAGGELVGVLSRSEGNTLLREALDRDGRLAGGASS